MFTLRPISLHLSAHSLRHVLVVMTMAMLPNAHHLAAAEAQKLYEPLTTLGLQLTFTPSATQQIGDYVVSSGLLTGLENSDGGSLVSVRSPQGSTLSLIDTPAKRGLLLTSVDGTPTFKEDVPTDWLKTDYIESPEEEAISAQAQSSDTPTAYPKIIDVLAGFSAASAKAVGDPKAYALAQVESVNLGLRNSKISAVHLNLLGIKIIDNDYPITTEVLSKLDELFPEGRQWGADTIAAFFIGNDQNTARGWGHVGGRLTVQTTNTSAAFRHEMGHNAGGRHCNEGQSSYKFGYNNGKSRTYLCGNDIAYYSNPYIRDKYGLPLGNINTANMARVWAENAARLSNYRKPEIPPLTLSGQSLGSDTIELSWNWGYITPQKTTLYRWLVPIAESRTSHYQDTGLHLGTTYRYHVIATDAKGHTAQSEYIWKATQD